MSKMSYLNITKKLDEFLFNYNHCVLPEYHGAAWMPVLPLLAGGAAGIYCFCYNGLGSITNEEVEQLKYFTLIIWLLNELLFIRHVFILPGLIRKFFYPIFVTVITVPALVLAMYCAYLALWLILIIMVAIMACVGLAASASRRVFRRNSDGTFTEI